MVAALAGRETVFSVLATGARGRAGRSLAVQLAVCVAAAGLVLLAAPAWWSVAALMLAGGTHAAWGLLVRRRSTNPSHAAGLVSRAPYAVAAVGTALAAIGILGLAAALFAGSGRSPYDACGVDAHSAYCKAMRAPAPATAIP